MDKILSKRIGGIYKIICTANNKFYLGSSIYIKRRWREHINDLKSYRHDNPYLQRAWNKYGEQSFRFEVLECILYSEKDLLTSREQEYLDAIFIKRQVAKTCYNFCKTANSRLGVKLSKKKKGKRVLQINFETLEVIKIFDSAIQAAESVDVKRSSITWCCNKRVLQIKGFYWRYEENFDPKKLTKFVKYERIKRKRVRQLDPKDRSVIKTWDSAREAALFFNINENNLSFCCRKRRTWKYAGFQWEYEVNS